MVHSKAETRIEARSMRAALITNYNILPGRDTTQYSIPAQAAPFSFGREHIDWTISPVRKRKVR